MSSPLSTLPRHIACSVPEVVEGRSGRQAVNGGALGPDVAPLARPVGRTPDATRPVGMRNKPTELVGDVVGRGNGALARLSSERSSTVGPTRHGGRSPVVGGPQLQYTLDHPGSAPLVAPAAAVLMTRREGPAPVLTRPRSP